MELRRSLWTSEEFGDITLILLTTTVGGIAKSNKNEKADESFICEWHFSSRRLFVLPKEVFRSLVNDKDYIETTVTVPD